jgi:hypothetical protein
MTDGFDVMAVGIANKCSEVARMICGKQTGLLREFGTEVPSDAKELVYKRARFCPECNMKSGQRPGCSWIDTAGVVIQTSPSNRGVNPEGTMSANTENDGVSKGEAFFYPQGLEQWSIERTTSRYIPHRQVDVIDHELLLSIIAPTRGLSSLALAAHHDLELNWASVE